jgi:hypothetical protein
MASMIGAVIVYEFYNKNHDYYYSSNPEPYDEGWKKVGQLGFVYESAGNRDNVSACYEFGTANDHYYSTNPQPYDANWGRSRTLGYVFTKEIEGASAVWEFYSSVYNCHYYSTNPEPRETCFGRGENPIFYVPNGILRTISIIDMLQEEQTNFSCG